MPYLGVAWKIQRREGLTSFFEEVGVFEDIAATNFISNRQSARPLRTRPHKRVTLIMVGFFTTEAASKSKHIRREELIRLENTHVFGNDS